jgi:hypothetical protein
MDALLASLDGMEARRAEEDTALDPHILLSSIGGPQRTGHGGYRHGQPGDMTARGDSDGSMVVACNRCISM